MRHQIYKLLFCSLPTSLLHRSEPRVAAKQDLKISRTVSPVSHVSCLLFRFSFESFLLSLVSFLSSPVSFLLSLVSCLLSYVSCLMSPVFCLLSPVSSLTSPVSRLLSHVSCLHSWALLILKVTSVKR